MRKFLARACILIGNFFHWCAGVRETVRTSENVM